MSSTSQHNSLLLFCLLTTLLLVRTNAVPLPLPGASPDPLPQPSAAPQPVLERLSNIVGLTNGLFEFRSNVKSSNTNTDSISAASISAASIISEASASAESLIKSASMVSKKEQTIISVQGSKTLTLLEQVNAGGSVVEEPGSLQPGVLVLSLTKSLVIKNGVTYLDTPILMTSEGERLLIDYITTIIAVEQ
ncbi:hypothetical protein DASC09_055030 [Saccharomycopsis crataegensis]|uniref:Uncharacterized protein n=1 Tax=Saccharomycopsis crataegensis TaxID=43959 RepID=A0AAV5QTS6_9ASCO|nr:hypothetical protein DASC09_055030 [Saccharomycopsis crataegensis]